MTERIELSGCGVHALAGYLKALGVQRLVAEAGVAGDPDVRSSWDERGVFVLESRLAADGLVRFFLERYAPTPMLTPWNGGSGFYPGDQQSGIAAIEAASDARFAPYQTSIRATRALLEHMRLAEKPTKEEKPRLMELCRSRLPDSFVTWIDAAAVLSDDPRYPPLLGTGGNDGRLDFANNFMQRLAELFLAPPARRRGPDQEARLRTALFGARSRQAYDAVAMGQFLPSLAGGANMTAGLDANSRVNPWDFVLMLEGALVFASAASRRCEWDAGGSASFPFHVSASGVGYASSASVDERDARAELWVPRWTRPTGYDELQRLFAEGRLDVGGRAARNGLDAARALASLGVDRGIERFERFAFLRRNGLAFLAAHLGSFDVRVRDGVDLLPELDPLVDQLRRLERPAPAVKAAVRRLEHAMLELCRADEQTQEDNDDAKRRRASRIADVLAALGSAFRALARSPKARAALGAQRLLTKAWAQAANDGSPEYAIAAALASWTVRGEWLSINDGQNGWWRFGDGHPTWTDAGVFENVVALAQQRLRTRDTGLASLGGLWSIDVPALHALLGLGPRALDVERLADLLFGLAFVENLSNLRGRPESPRGSLAAVPVSFCALRAVTSPTLLGHQAATQREPVDKHDEDGAGKPPRHPAPHIVPAILAQVSAGRARAAVALAARRLRGSGVALKADPLWTQDALGAPCSRAAFAAALVLPLAPHLEARLAQRVLRAPRQS